MKCVHCGQRRGKRRCPALSGDICPQCCGEHRLKTIDCPSTCEFLGALSVLAGASSSSGAAAAGARPLTKADIDRELVPALTDFNDWFTYHSKHIEHHDIVL